MTCAKSFVSWAGANRLQVLLIVDSRTLCSTCESGPRAGYDGAKKRSGSKVHIAVDLLGHLLALSVTPADEGDRSQIETLCESDRDAV